MAKQTPYQTIIDKLIKEIGEPTHAQFKSDKIRFKDLGFGVTAPKFNNPTQDWLKDTQKESEDTKSAPNEDQFKDENKQLQLPGSSTIQSAAYWKDKEYLVVSFKSGATYSYDKVPVDMVKAWEKAPSAGSYFYYNIRMSYSYRKMG